MQTVREKTRTSRKVLGAEWGDYVSGATHLIDQPYAGDVEFAGANAWTNLIRFHSEERNWYALLGDVFEDASSATSMFGAYLNRLLETNRGEDKRIRQVNQYFKIKAGDVLADESCVKFLANLYEVNAMSYEEVDINENSLALAKLAAAGFAELGELKFQITETGCRFIDSILAQ